MFKCLWKCGKAVGDNILVANLSLEGRKGKDVLIKFPLDDISIASMADAQKRVHLHVRSHDDEIVFIDNPDTANFLSVLSQNKRLKTDSPTRADSKFLFFGTPAVAELALQYKLRREAPAEILGPFKTQRDALSALEQRGSDIRVYTCETEAGGGAREFFLGSVKEMAKHLQQMPSSARCWYELIRENTPVRVYLDVEWSKVKKKDKKTTTKSSFSGHFQLLNPHLDGIVVMRELMQLLIEFLSLNFPSLAQSELSYFVELESIYEAKFSRHVVFPSVVIEDSSQVRRYSERKKRKGIS